MRDPNVIGPCGSNHTLERRATRTLIVSLGEREPTTLADLRSQRGLSCPCANDSGEPLSRSVVSPVRWIDGNTAPRFGDCVGRLTA
jgi:hypothetical protein